MKKANVNGKGRHLISIQHVKQETLCLKETRWLVISEVGILGDMFKIRAI